MRMQRRSNIRLPRLRAASAVTCVTYIRRMACIYMTYVLCMYIFILEKQHLTIETASCISHYMYNIYTSYGMYIYDICFMYVHIYIEKATSDYQDGELHQPLRVWHMYVVWHVYPWHMFYVCTYIYWKSNIKTARCLSHSVCNIYVNYTSMQYQTTKTASCSSNYLYDIYMTYGMDIYDMCYACIYMTYVMYVYEYSQKAISDC